MPSTAKHPTVVQSVVRSFELLEAVGAPTDAGDT